MGVNPLHPILAEAVVKAIISRVPGYDFSCPLCHNKRWSINGAYNLHPDVWVTASPPSNSLVAPFVALVCPTEGYSMFFAILSLISEEQLTQLLNLAKLNAAVEKDLTEIFTRESL